MSLPPFLQRKPKTAEPGGDDPSPVQEARTRARRRLIGAVVLLGLGVVGFPLLFETKPRPVPVDIPIEVARRDTPAALLPPPARPAAAVVVAPLPADAGIEAPAPAPAAAAASSSLAAPPASAASAASPRPAAEAPSAPRTGRFVVQVGAYTDPTALRESRQKVEKIGLKTYTQVIDTEAGKRTRVRVGPFDTRDEAEKAAVRLKSTGLPANILAL